MEGCWLFSSREILRGARRDSLYTQPHTVRERRAKNPSFECRVSVCVQSYISVRRLDHFPCVCLCQFVRPSFCPSNECCMLGRSTAFLRGYTWLQQASSIFSIYFRFFFLSSDSRIVLPPSELNAASSVVIFSLVLYYLVSPNLLPNQPTNHHHHHLYQRNAFCCLFLK